MCGIAGVLERDSGAGRQRPAATAAARLIADRLAHRGPDDHGEWSTTDASVALAHRRLSIIDLSPLGRNPLLWDGGRLAIAFNGEIYNFQDLRRELESAGHRFRTRTDTEVILAAYDQWGTACVSRLVGMFAFALWDEPRRRLWLVRDRLGKKPLYYADWGGRLTFASELQALLGGELPRDIDSTALGLYLRYGYVPAPHTILAHVRKLAPGHHLVCEAGAISVHRYWDPLAHVADTERTPESAEADLEERLSEAVRQRLIADVPLGAFLSGGIDSSLIVAMMKEQSGSPVRTFTIRFPQPEYCEADHAAAVARHLGTEHYEQLCDERQMLGVIDCLPEMYGEPFADSSAVPTYILSKITSAHVTVALSGDGGDELFFGYPRYVHYADRAWALGLPAPVRAAAAGVARHLPTRRLRRVADVLSQDDADFYGRFVAFWSHAEIARMTGAPAAVAPFYAEALDRAAGWPPAQVPPVLDLVSYLPDDILTKVDRASMAVGLEVRAPLLDHRVVELALELPLALKRRGGETKWLLRRLLYKRVPRELVDRPKMGFGVPLADWFRGPLRDRMNDYCSGPDLEDLGLDPGPIRTAWRSFGEGRPIRPDLLWQAFVLVAWSRRFRSVSGLVVAS
jgi:asparagine synthase (glutamine-hydrolysing)